MNMKKKKIAEQKRKKLQYKARLEIFSRHITDLCEQNGITLPIPKNGYIEALYKYCHILFSEAKSDEEIVALIRSFLKDCG